MSSVLPDLSLVILGFRNFDGYTRRCLESLRPWASDQRIELLVIDNGSEDGATEQTAAWCEAHPGFRFLPSGSNLGFAGGMNFGARHAKGRWLLLVNNDTIFPEGALDALLRVTSQAADDVAMLGMVTNAAGNGQRLWLAGQTVEQMLETGRKLIANPTGELMPTYRSDFFCVAIRHDVWEELGGLDTQFGLGYYEDFEFSLRLRKAGYRQMITEDVFILHVGSATFKGSKSAHELLKRNKKLLRAKHSDARFEHSRQGNLAVLEAYRELQRAGRWSPALQMRLDLRLPALEGEAPRSPLKKWLWRRKVARLAREMQLST